MCPKLYHEKGINMNQIELLSPVGDFECLKAAVQAGADCVYFGGSMFNARASAGNFDDESLKKAIEYAKIRNVKTNLALNILIKNDEFNDAFELAKKAYEYGIDAIIVQDLGLAKKLIETVSKFSEHRDIFLDLLINLLIKNKSTTADDPEDWFDAKVSQLVCDIRMPEKQQDVLSF
jgi:hypothetical protein